MTTDCPGCKEAETGGTPHAYYANCASCEARELLRYDDTKQAMAEKRMTPGYRKRLADKFVVGWEAGHKEVKRWWERLSAETSAK